MRKEALLLLGFVRKQLGLRNDAASATGSAHAKLAHIVANTGIKSIQRGTIALGASDTTKAAKISAVDTTKTMINLLGVRASDRCYAHDPGGAGILYPAATSHFCVTLTLTSGTAVTAARQRHRDTAATISYEVIEFV